MIDLKRVESINHSAVIIGDINLTIAYLSSKISRHNIRLIGNDNGLFTIDLAKKAMNESLISSNEYKYIVLYGKQFRLEALNALLKSLEEPPRNIVFIIITNNRANIIPTVISRLYIYSYKEDVKAKEILDKLDYRNITEKDGIKLILKYRRITRDELKDIIMDIIKLDGINNYKSFNTKELERLTSYIKLLNVNSIANNILTALVMLLVRNNESRKLKI